MMPDLIHLCYPKRSPQECRSVEEWFHESLQSQDFTPLRRLCDTLMEADYYLAPRLIRTEGEQTSSYGRFFQQFRAADFITFNYDSFVEAALLRMRRWIPTDGYGLPVFAAQMPVRAEGVVIPANSDSLVLHLHGSLCVYESHFAFSEVDSSGVHWLQQKPEIEYAFDPDSLGHLFVPWERVVQPLLGVDPVQERVIAPVPNKADGLRRAFVMSVRSRAEDVIREADSVVAVGYRFNPVDEESFGFLLSAIAERDGAVLTVVSPSAEATVERLAKSYADVSFRAIPLGFSDWASAGFTLDSGAV
jgi:hypothetical protein